MESHITIEVAGKSLTMPQDQSIDFEEQNPMFHDTEMFSYPAKLPFDYNRHAFKNLDDRDSTLRAVDVEGQVAKIVLDGLPLRTSILHVQENEVLEDKISVSFDSRDRSFKDMIKNMKCRDVSEEVAKDNIQIGEKVGRTHLIYAYKMWYTVYFIFSDGNGYHQSFLDTDKEDGEGEQYFTPPVNGFSYPGLAKDKYKTVDGQYVPDVQERREYTGPDGETKVVNVPYEDESFINTSKPYPLAKYCNSRICYTHYDVDKNDDGTYDTSQYTVPADKAKFVYEDYGPYWVLDAKRPASGICFYVGYFLEVLFRTLGVDYDISALTAIEDFNYMAFFTTACKCDERERHDIGSANPQLKSIGLINSWLNIRGTGGMMIFDTETAKEVKTDVSEITAKYHGEEYTFKVGELCPDVPLSEISKIERRIEFTRTEGQAYINDMYASADNFPDATVTEVIESLENSFGCRFYYNPETNKVTVYLLRDIFRSQKAPIHLNAHINSMFKMTEKITGFRMKYDGESDPEEQRENVRLGKRDYDTDYDYIDYPDGRTQVKTYGEVVQRIDAVNMNCYVSPDTGNAIRIKVDKDATSFKEMKPVAFEVGQYKGVDIGDCSQEAEDNDTIVEVVSSFQPINVNDVNFRNGGTSKPDYQPLLVPFCDDDMEHEFIESEIQNTFLIEDAEAYLTYKLCGVESYDPGDTDDGSSPLMTHDWGLAIGILRTGDGGAGIENYDPNYDGFGNWKWRDIADNYCMSSDTMDQRGMWLGKTDKANTFSLKIRAWKPILYYTDGDGTDHVIPYDESKVGKPVAEGSHYTWLIPCNDDERSETGKITKRVRSRGLFDTFMSEYAQFLLERQKYQVKALVEIAQLADIPNHWRDRFEIEGKIGYIDKYTYKVDCQQGVGEVTFEFYSR